MSADVTTAIMVITFTVLRLGVPVLGVWLLSKGLRYSLAVLP